MGWFTKPRATPRVRTSIGTFIFDGRGWLTQPAENNVVIMYCNEELDVSAIDKAQSLIGRIEELSDVGRSYAKSAQPALLDASDDLVLEAIDVTDVADAKVGLTFGVRDDPDRTFTVEFRNGSPYSLWGAD